MKSLKEGIAKHTRPAKKPVARKAGLQLEQVKAVEGGVLAGLKLTPGPIFHCGADAIRATEHLLKQVATNQNA